MLNNNVIYFIIIETILPETTSSDTNLINGKIVNHGDDLSKLDFEYVWEDIPTKSNTDVLDQYSCPINNVIREDDVPYTFCWPRDWLSKDCSNIRLLGIHYRTSLSMWAPICTLEKVQFTLEETSNKLLMQLITAGVGQRPIIWVTHSMGGLIVKNVLCKGCSFILCPIFYLTLFCYLI